MKNGIEYSKSKKLRIFKRTDDYYIVQQLEGENWVQCSSNVWAYLNNARFNMLQIERILCPQ